MSMRLGSLRLRLVCLFLCSASIPAANADDNIFSKAWDCAKGSAEAGYQLAGKGAQALEVLGGAPQCVAYATAGDIPLYATTGALFTLNAIDSSIVSSTNCVSSVKSHAVVPMGQLLNGAFGGVIPANLLDAGSQEATDQLWEFMGSTPPVSEAISRVECGCTFLEAGVSVQNLVEIFTIIAQAGEKCDSFLDEVPGYQSVKAGVKAGGTAMNNLGEDIFTDQVQHKDVEAYYFYDFDGGVDSYATRSHAIARVLDPAHNWRTQEGAMLLSETDVKLGGGANNGEQYANKCRNYFDSHKMSADNAAEVCEAMLQRFDNDYKSMVARMAAHDAMIKQLKAKLPGRTKQAVAECDKRFPPEGASVNKYGYYEGSGASVSAHNSCTMSMRSAGGSMEWRSPYNGVGGLGEPIDPAITDAILATGKPYFFLHPIAMSGAMRIAYEAFENNGGNAGAAVAQGLLAHDMMRDKTLKDSKINYDKMVKLLAENKAAKIKGAAGFAFPNCPTGANYKACIDALGDAVEVCITQTGSVPLSGEFPKPGEQLKIDAIEKQCAAGYVGLAVALGKRNSLDISMRANLLSACPPANSGLRLSCAVDVQEAISSCQGGVPRMTSGYFISKLFAQDPTPQASCALTSSVFKAKWAADDVQIARINSATPTALKACINKVPDSAACQTQVGALAESCRADLQETANILLSGVSLQSEQMGDALDALVKNADGCIAQMMSVSARLGAGKEAEVLMLQKYGNSCMRNEDCKQQLIATLHQCQGIPSAGSATRTGGGRPVDSSGRRASTGDVAVSARNNMVTRSYKLAKAPSPVAAAMNNPSAFSVGNTVMQLAKTPSAVVAECEDELQAVLAKFDKSNVPNVGAPIKIVTLPPKTTGGVVGPVMTTTQPTTTRTTTGGRPPPRINVPTDGRRAEPAAPVVLYRMPAPGGTTVTLEVGMDRMGGDFRGFALDQADPQQCRQACADDSACKSYTYVNPGLKGPQAMCFLKNTTPPATADACCTSGQKKQATGR